MRRKDVQIEDEISRIIALLGGDEAVLGAIDRWGDSMPDDEVLSLLRAWREREEARRGKEEGNSFENEG
jgi:hypothetical protein